MSPRVFCSLVILLGFAVAGCSKKEQPPAATAPTQAQTPQAASSAQGTAPAAQPAQPTYATVDAGIAQARAAMRAKEYDRAANALSNLRTTGVPMTGQQLMSLNKAQADLQNQLGAAAAAGDPKAKAAYEMLRQRALYHH